MVQFPEFVNALAPATAFGKESQIIRRASGPSVAAMIARINGVVGAGQRRQPRLAGGMLCKAVSNLHRSLRSRIG